MTTPHLSADRSAALRALRSVRAHAEPEDGADALARVWWSHLAEPGDADAGRLVAAAGAGAALRLLHAADRSGLAAHGVSDPAAALGRWSPRRDARAVDDGLRTAAQRGIHLLLPRDREWPRRVDDLGPHAPLCLWVRGDLGALATPRPSVAIVGARASTSYGEHVAVELAAELAALGITVVSGGAYGIDGAAHRAALGAGGSTIALMAGGADRAYPAGHAHLLDRVAAQGAVVSEVPCGAAPTKWRFLARNRVIAALADATVVVEAGWRSGSLNTAGHAAALGRPLGAVPGPVTSAASAGTHRLLREYDATCITSSDDVRELLGIGSHQPPLFADDRASGDAVRVRDALSTRSWRAADDIARRSGLDGAVVEAALGLMLLGGEVERGADGWRRLPAS